MLTKLQIAIIAQPKLINCNQATIPYAISMKSNVSIIGENMEKTGTNIYYAKTFYYQYVKDCVFRDLIPIILLWQPVLPLSVLVPAVNLMKIYQMEFTLTVTARM